MTPHALREHVEMAPSAASRWLKCPGSIRLIRTLPPGAGGPSAYADEGTAAHELAQTILHEEDESVVIDADPEMLRNLEPYLTYCRTIRKSADLTVVECPITLSDLGPPARLGGTSDFVGVVPAHESDEKILYVVDLKYGAGVPVEVPNNSQLMVYALGATVLMQAMGYKIGMVVSSIVQPRAPHPDGVIRSATYTPMELLDWCYGTLFPGMAAALQEDAPLVPGESQCQFCPARALCPAAAERGALVAQTEFGVMPSPNLLPIEMLSKLLSAFPEMEDWMTACRQFAHGELELGREVPGWKLVAKRANRTWKPEKDIELIPWLARMRPNIAIHEIYTVPELKSPAQVEKVTGLDVPEDFVNRISSGTTLAPINDARPGVAGHALEFAAIGEAEAAPLPPPADGPKKRGRKKKIDDNNGN